jgi:hypothetical protein
MCHRIGMPPISTIGLGRISVSSANRVPNPPARIPTFMLSPLSQAPHLISDFHVRHTKGSLMSVGLQLSWSLSFASAVFEHSRSAGALCVRALWLLGRDVLKIWISHRPVLSSQGCAEGDATSIKSVVYRTNRGGPNAQTRRISKCPGGWNNFSMAKCDLDQMPKRLQCFRCWGRSYPAKIAGLTINELTDVSG